MPPGVYSRGDPIARFWSRVDRSGGPDACWPWIRRGDSLVTRCSYGAAMFDGRRVLTHRFAYEVTKGPIPDGLIILHACDNPPCCNPAHLRAGTYADNTRDMMTKGRAATGSRSGAHTHPEQVRRGADHGCAKLTDADIPDIFAMRATGALPKAIADAYGVSREGIRNVLSRHSWGHVPIDADLVAAFAPRRRRWRALHKPS